MTLTSMHLFAGAGGGLLADLILGHDPVAAVEWDPYCCAVLRERAAEGWFPGLQVYEGDVRMFNASDWKGRVDCIHAGFPCQDISGAGKRMGVDEGTRSGLYREILRVADVVRPQFLFLENVSAILSNGLGTVLGDLAARGYDGRWCCLRASEVGANHQRDRWWMLAYAVPTRERRNERQGENEGHVVPNTQHGRIPERWGTDHVEEKNTTGGRRSIGIRSHDEQIISEEKKQTLADTEGKRWGEERRDIERQTERITSGGETLANVRGARTGREGSSNDCGRDASLPVGGVVDELAPNLGGSSWWEVEPEIGRTVKKEENRVAKLKALGNGQVPLQAALAFRILMGRI